MNVTSCTNADIESFFSLDDSRDFEEAVRRLFDEGHTIPQWCFILADGNTLVGRAGFMTSGGTAMRLFGLLLPEENFTALGKLLLEQSMKEISREGVTSVEYQLYTDEFPPEAQDLFRALGMRIVQGKKRLERDLEAWNTVSSRLNYISYKEAGYMQFCDAVKQVTRNTLDRDNAEAVRTLGDEEAADMYMQLLLAMDETPDNWLLGYQNGNLVGLVVPQLLSNTTGLINYIGTVPEARGKGFGLELLAKGLESLKTLGCTDVVADIDTENYAVERILTEAGFRETRKMLLLKKEMS